MFFFVYDRPIGLPYKYTENLWNNLEKREK